MDLQVNMEEIKEAVKPTVAVEDRYLTVDHPRQTKEWAQADSGSQKKLTAAHRWMTCCAVHA
jgi:hypothetical protein